MSDPIDADGFSFHFTDAIHAFVFDEKDKTKPTFHGVPMKGVDIVAEFDQAYVYVELKRLRRSFNLRCGECIDGRKANPARPLQMVEKLPINTNVEIPISTGTQNKKWTNQCITFALSLLIMRC